MNGQQMHLHSENFDLCRICLMEPESNRNVQFVQVFEQQDLHKQFTELLGIKIDKDDIKPKIICEGCHKSLLEWVKMKKKATESEVIINYIAKKKFGINPAGTNQLTTNGNYSLNNQSVNAAHSSNRSLQNIIGSTSSVIHPSNIQTTSLNCSGSSNRGILNQSFIMNPNTKTEIDNSDSNDDPTKITNIKIELMSNNEGPEISDFGELCYCSICKMKQTMGHNCSEFNNEFSTCLVPNCNILSRSTKDIIPHYLQHMALPPSELLCQFCFQPIKLFDCDGNGRHINCVTINAFKCYICDIGFNSMAEFSDHKLKTHPCQLINDTGNYLCLFCENSYSDLTAINEHMTNCHESPIKIENDMEVENGHITNETQTFTKIIKDEKNEKIVPENGAIKLRRLKEKKDLRSSKRLLFTCTKPFCNLIFSSFSLFKFHHRKHFEISKNDLICWQCCSPFSNINYLRMHQVKSNCVTPGMFKCFQCDEKFDDIQSLSIHKYTLHDGDLIMSRKGKKLLKCVFCRTDINIQSFKEHLVNCTSKNTNKIASKPTLLKKGKWHKCSACGKICLTAAALTNHKKVHNSSTSKKTVTTRMSNTSNSIQKKKHELANTSNSGEIRELNRTSSTSHTNNMGTNINMDNTAYSGDTAEEIN